MKRLIHASCRKLSLGSYGLFTLSKSRPVAVLQPALIHETFVSASTLGIATNTNMKSVKTRLHDLLTFLFSEKLIYAKYRDMTARN